ncbi:MAG: AAA family ATPase [Dysgonamonadaceae bacterium]|jgi:hypothetical protein|nr:AAA family ATPase [Dysgonamonadaceae bacterium]
MKKTKVLRVVFKAFAGANLFAETESKQPLTLVCTPDQLQELAELSSILRPGNVFNLLNVTADAATVSAEFLVFEPDYLLDISALAECFRPHGNHFLNYTLSRFREKEMTPSILLGNMANFFIDELLNESAESPVEYQSAIRKMFKASAFEFTTCEALKDPETEIEFFAASRKQFDNISYIVRQVFPKTYIDREKVMLEPAFVCNALGLQGRLDLMLSDCSAFIELKSGKAFQDFHSGRFVRSTESHYTQMILYLAVLEFNLGLKADDVRSYLLYSKYPLLSLERHSRKQLQAALRLRNQITAREYALHTANDAALTGELLAQMHSKTLNTKALSGKFFNNYLAPSIDRFAAAFAALNETEKAYFLRVYTFLAKELWLSKAGEREDEGAKRAAIMWNAPFEDKLAAGELLHDLTITDNRAADDNPAVCLQIPARDDLFLPNFRPGDSVVLYRRDTAADTVNNHQVFKGVIELLESDRIIIRLRNKQKNPQVWNANALYAVEHDYMDTTFAGMFRALSAFLHANRDRKALILGGRFNDHPISLLVGPPGTGKTSIALKGMVETELQTDGHNVLLLAYTNRAVDEICKALAGVSRALPYIRLGSELNCAPAFRPYLLENALNTCNNRRDVAEVIGKCRVFVGTAAAVWNKPELFRLKHFNLALIDEATQLLEPHLLGVLCVRNGDGENAVDRFVLIGDHKQLPAIVLQSKEESRVSEPALNAVGLTDLSNSLFERLYRKYGADGFACAMLTRQGRMHPAIAAFPSRHFYDDRLETAGLPHQMEEWTDRSRLRFYSVKPLENEPSDRANLNEALKVLEICRELYAEPSADDVFNPDDIGIITPYRNQIALIRKLLQESGINALADIMVDTVERFQGSQRDAIIYSFCVKTESRLAALPNWMEENGTRIDRKLNVALTRARKRLFIVGNDELLGGEKLYRGLIEHIVSIR